MKRQSQILLGLCLVSTSLAIPRPTQNPIYLSHQDSLGEYSYGYSAPGSARSEVRLSNGEIRGSYSYVDGDWMIQTAEYTADREHGFRIAATNLPQAVEDTPEVMAAREAHLAALRLAYERDQQLGQKDLTQQQLIQQQQLGQGDFGLQQQLKQQQLGQQDWERLVGNVVVEAKTRNPKAEMMKETEAGVPANKIAGQVYRNVVSQVPEALQSPEVDAARRAYVQAISAASSKAERKGIEYMVNDVITKVSQSLGPVVEATVTDGNGAVIQHVG